MLRMKSTQNERKIQIKAKQKTKEKKYTVRDGDKTLHSFSASSSIHDAYNLLVSKMPVCLGELEFTNYFIQQPSLRNIFRDTDGLQKVNYACYLIVKRVITLSIASDWKQPQNLCNRRSTLQLVKQVNMLNLNKMTVGQCIQEILLKYFWSEEHKTFETHEEK